MTINTVAQSIEAIVEGLGFDKTVDEFDFELQPAQVIDMTYHVRTSRVSSIGEVGTSQIEVHRVEIWLALTVKRDPFAARESLKSFMDQLEGLVYADTADYNLLDESTESDVRLSGMDADYVMGVLSMQVDFDRIP